MKPPPAGRLRGTYPHHQCSIVSGGLTYSWGPPSTFVAHSGGLESPPPGATAARLSGSGAASRRPAPSSAAPSASLTRKLSSPSSGPAPTSPVTPSQVATALRKPCKGRRDWPRRWEAGRPHLSGPPHTGSHATPWSARHSHSAEAPVRIRSAPEAEPASFVRCPLSLPLVLGSTQGGAGRSR